MSQCDENSRKELMDYLSQNKITVMSTVGCPACVDAKNLLNKKEYRYSELDLTKEDNEKYFNCLSFAFSSCIRATICWVSSPAMKGLNLE